MLPLIGVIGGRQCTEEVSRTAEQVGKLIARQGFGLVCGGLGGVMESAARGCQKAGGLTVGILPQAEGEAANPYIDVVIPTGMGISRNLLVVRSARGLVALEGKYGTLSEIAFALQLNIPIASIGGGWNQYESIYQAADPQDAVKYLCKQIAL